jgi:hypothetical protein
MKLTTLLSAFFVGLSSFVYAQSIHFVKPADTDPSIDLRLEPHIVVTPEANLRKDKLLVFFPGTYGTAGGYGEFLQHAADSGIYALGLNYPNDTAFADVCRNTQDADCFEKGRLEIFDGQDRHPDIEVNASNSIKNRLEKALLYLHETYPNENWDRFITNDTTNWSKLILSGHSQGAGHAGIISKHRSVARVIMFAGMDFFTNGLRPADWIAKEGLTNGDKLYGFTHLRDPGFFVANPPIQVRTWTNYGMDTFGPLTNVDTADVASLKSHMLCSDLEPKSANGVSNNYHGGLIVDPYIPVSSGKIVYLNTWSYLLGLGSAESTVGISEYESEIEVSVKNGRVQLTQSVEELSLYSLVGQELGSCKNCRTIAVPIQNETLVVITKSNGKIHSEKVMLRK